MLVTWLSLGWCCMSWFYWVSNGKHDFLLIQLYTQVLFYNCVEAWNLKTNSENLSAQFWFPRGVINGRRITTNQRNGYVPYQRPPLLSLAWILVNSCSACMGHCKPSNPLEGWRVKGPAKDPTLTNTATCGKCINLPTHYTYLIFMIPKATLHSVRCSIRTSYCMFWLFSVTLC